VINFLFLMAVTFCLVSGFFVAMRGNDPARQEADSDGGGATAFRVHTNGASERD
jgi:hypothetical protein